MIKLWILIRGKERKKESEKRGKIGRREWTEIRNKC
jgi:hypothetical protein